MKIKFTKYKRRPDDKLYVTGPDGQLLYRLYIDDELIREGLTLEEVVEAINRRDEETMLPLPVAEEGSTVSPQPRQWRAASEAGPGLATRQGEQESLGERHVPGGCIR